jgi:hypothetical protein
LFEEASLPKNGLIPDYLGLKGLDVARESEEKIFCLLSTVQSAIPVQLPQTRLSLQANSH